MNTIEHEILERLQSIDLRLTGLERALGERCSDHQRQLDAQQLQLSDLKRRNGLPPRLPPDAIPDPVLRSLGAGSSPIAWADPKFFITALAALAALATAIAAVCGAR